MSTSVFPVHVAHAEKKCIRKGSNFQVTYYLVAQPLSRFFTQKEIARLRLILVEIMTFFKARNKLLLSH